jgi:hypothetical protein
MMAALSRHLPVATCIGCGARSQSAECSDGCTDVALDLVDAGALATLAARSEALEVRVAALRALARTVAADAPPGWTAIHAQARAALRLPVPAEPEIEIIEAWGCPVCGRVDAPRPCLGICVRRPGTVADVREYRELAPRAERARAADRALSGLAHILATVTPRPGREELTTARVRSQARDLLGVIDG